ncbi:MAG TPA: nucleotidyltransferase domain-containing protein [Burkholderiales bacterium]|nr:nucleotidyltransferase domain-containing protein [Burkholderiales bacterium]
MYEHHAASIQRVTEYFRTLPEVQALILGGSIAHGFASPSSDIDLMIIVSDGEYEERLRDGRLQYFDNQLCTYEGGYAEGKYLCPQMVAKLAHAGSEPARFAFLDSQILLSRMDNLEETIRSITRYPVEGKPERLRRFYAQFEAWHWYANEGVRLNDPYLLGISVAKLVLFGARLILAHNELLYPYHKWLLKVLERAPDKPADLSDCIADVHNRPSAETIGKLYETIGNFRAWEFPDVGWPNQFMLDSELGWLTGATAVDDL